jgi:Amt family ammonium transporter
VHLVNGIWGTLALGIFYHGKAEYGDSAIATTVAALDTGLSRSAQFMVQLKGVLMVGATVFVLALVVWYALKVLGGIRVSAEEETEGLDVGEHGIRAYHFGADTTERS